jgi:hypothetical protein
MEILSEGSNNRHIGATSMNIESSRSHSVFTIYLESKVNLKSFFNKIKKLIFLVGKKKLKKKYFL